MYDPARTAAGMPRLRPASRLGGDGAAVSRHRI